MGRKNEFIKNTAILFIGKFATQFMSLLLLPLFTHFLLSKDYGMVDLLQTYITLFIPIFTLRIDSAVFRFLIDKRNDDERKTLIITNVLLILLLGVITVSIISVMILFLVKIKYLQYVIFNIIALMMSNILLQVLRGLGKNKEYSICSIITGTVTLISNVTLIIIFKVGAESILISSTIANIVCILTVVKIVDIV